MTEQTQPTPRRRNWMRITLIVSLAVNLLIVGLVAGAILRHGGGGNHHMDRMTMGFGAYIRALPEPARSELSAEIGMGRDAKRSFRRAMRERQANVTALIAQKPFSAEAVRAALEENRAFALTRTQGLQEAWIDAVSQMTEAERDAYFARVAEYQKKRKSRKWRTKNKSE